MGNYFTLLKPNWFTTNMYIIVMKVLNTSRDDNNKCFIINSKTTLI